LNGAFFMSLPIPFFGVFLHNIIAMPKNIFIYETRPVNYLQPYLGKAKSLGFNVTVINNPPSADNKLYNEFIKHYKHYSVNPPEFEIACFARYFAIATLLKNDEPFLMTDTDVYIAKSFRNVQGYKFEGSFVGSEGFDERGSQLQISPHCTFWNRELLMDFLDFTVDVYKRNYEHDFLGEFYRSQTEKYIQTSVSDMSLLYMWTQQRNVPCINSNSTKFELGIDHNLSTHICEDDEFKTFADRKKLKISNDKITCSLKSGKKMDMALLHFQGPYKPILKRFYLKRYAKFIHFSLRNNYRHNKKIFRK